MSILRTAILTLHLLCIHAQESVVSVTGHECHPVKSDGGSNQCTCLSNPRNGIVEILSYSPGGNASYTCNSGYTLSGSHVLKCLSNGSWSASEPSCKKITCSPLSPPINGAVSVNSYDYGGRATYSCNNGYHLNGKTSIRNCFSSEDWSGSAPNCIKECPSLTDPSNGGVSVSYSGGTATYSCNDGYGIVGSSTRSCSSSGDWSGSAPTCEKVCPSLSDPSNGAVIFNSNPGGTATYSCNTGYRLSGSSTHSCLPNGRWSASVPTCIRITCSPLSHPINGTVSVDSYDYGGTATYSCNTGYHLNGKTSIRNCFSSEDWSGSAPNCTKECPSLTDPSNGGVSVSWYYSGGTATYSCNTGFRLSGLSIRTCLSTGSWSGSPPACERIECLPLTDPSNGKVFVGSRYLRDEAIYTCEAGYTLNGSSVRTCFSNGNWSELAPTCERITCSPLSHPINGAVSVDSYDYGGTATYSCNTGYYLDGNTSIRNCFSSEDWSGSAPNCTRIECLPLTDPSNGKVSVGSRYLRDEAIYTCEVGYTLNGSSVRTCFSNGNWSELAPTCERITCSPLSHPINGAVSVDSYDYGGTATYSCNTGYYLDGNTSIRNCFSSEDWSGSAPNCTIIKCLPPLSDPSNGNVRVTSHSFGGIATYSCNTGYILVGQSILNCTEFGHWSGPLPTCEKECPSLTDPSNGGVSVSWYYSGGTATYSCKDGYDIVGSSSRVCSSSGGWSGSAPTCERVCPSLSHPTNGSVSVNTTNVGGTATYFCNDGYSLAGSSSRSCTSEGRWSGLPSICRKITCPHLSSPSNGKVSVSSLYPEGRATYSCDSTYTLYGSSNRICFSNGSWSGPETSCESECTSGTRCPPLNIPINGRVQVSSYCPGGRASYSCTDGYTLSGSISRTCGVPSGVWSGLTPTCESVICSSLTSPKNGHVTVSTHEVGGLALYSCDNGYQLVGQRARYCSTSQTWIGPEPVCQAGAKEPCILFDYESLIEEQTQVVQSIIEEILPEQLSDETIYKETASFLAFDSLAKKHDASRSETNFNKFSRALTEITMAKSEACSRHKVLVESDFTQIAETFGTELSKNPRNRDYSKLRFTLGKMLCIKEQDISSRTKRSEEADPMCPDPIDPAMGITMSRNYCQFFDCLNKLSASIESVFGFEEFAGIFQCLAFLIDTTGSMASEISDARNIILDFLRAEDDFGGLGCYMLVPFNDIDTTGKKNVPDESVGPISTTYTDDHMKLIDLYNNVIDLNAAGGWDAPEYCLDAIKDALEYKEQDDPNTLLWPGSQIIVLTDAPSKNTYLRDNVTRMAKAQGICIHFFTSDDALSDGVYEYIANETTGTVVDPYDKWKLATFISEYANRKCNQLNPPEPSVATSPAGRRKRYSPECHSFQVSQLASIIKFSGKSTAAVMISSPSESVVVVPQNYLSVYSEINPEAGQWRACVETGTLEISTSEDISIDATIIFFSSENKKGSVIPPHECSIGGIAFVTHKAPYFRTVNLNLVDASGQAAHTIIMTSCGFQGFTATGISFPHGSYSYQINGTDTFGTPILFDIRNRLPAVFAPMEGFSIELDENNPKEIEFNTPVIFGMSIRNKNDYSTALTLSSPSLGFTKDFQQSKVTILPNSSVQTNVTIRAFSLAYGSHTITIEAANECITLSTSMTIQVTGPANDCGCLNGGMCSVFARRGRTFYRCHCPSGYSGTKCHIRY